MLLFIPSVTYVLFYLILRRMRFDWRTAAIGASVFCGTAVVLITEVLSVPYLLTRSGVALSWTAIGIGAFAFLKLYSFRNYAVPQSGGESIIHSDGWSKTVLIATGLLVSFILVIALVAPPNTWDAMEYHLPRAVMWMSNHSVAFFATPDYAQLVWGPWAEYAMTHIALLWDGDRLVNLVQFLSFLGCILSVSLIAKQIGAGRRGQVLAAMLCATIPQGLLEASGAMNTYAVSFWITATVIFVIRWREQQGWPNTLLIGLSTGLAVMTKGVAYIYLPFIMLACWWMGSTPVRIRFLKRAVVFALLILVLNGPHYYRTYRLTGSPLATPLATQYPRLQIVASQFGVRNTAASVLRNIGLHIGTPSEALNSRIDGVVRGAIRAMGVDPDDPSAIYLNVPFHVSHYSLSEVHAGNPIHLLLLLAAIPILFFARRSEGTKLAYWYALGLVMAFLFMCAMLRWTEWSGRYQLALFVLSTGLTGFVLERHAGRNVTTAITIAVFLFALPFAVSNRLRSLVPWSLVDDVYKSRDKQYFADQHQRFADANIAAAEAVRQTQCSDVGIDTYLENSVIGLSPISQYVYPMLAMIHANGSTRRVWYTDVHNSTAQFAKPQNPCAVICFDCARVPAKWKQYESLGGTPQVFDYIVLFRSSTPPVLASGMGANVTPALHTPIQPAVTSPDARTVMPAASR